MRRSLAGTIHVIRPPSGGLGLSGHARESTQGCAWGPALPNLIVRTALLRDGEGGSGMES